MMTSLAILASGISPDATCNCGGTYRLGNAIWHCWSRRGHGSTNLRTGLPRSCDVYFYTFGRAAGIEAIATMARKFGLGAEVRPAACRAVRRAGARRRVEGASLQEAVGRRRDAQHVDRPGLPGAQPAAIGGNGVAAGVRPGDHAAAACRRTARADPAPRHPAGASRHRPPRHGRRRQWPRRHRALGQAAGRGRRHGRQDRIGPGPPHQHGRPQGRPRQHQVPALEVPRPRAVRCLHADRGARATRSASSSSTVPTVPPLRSSRATC